MTGTSASPSLFKIGGNGSIVLLLHSFTGSPTQMEPLADFLSGLGFTVSVPCLSGHGTKIEDMARVTKEDWLADVREALISAADETDRVHVVGTSMGALLALHLASEYPAVMRTLTLVNTPLRFRRAKTYLAHIVKYIRPIHRWEQGDERSVALPYQPYRVQYDGYAMSALASFVGLSITARRHAREVSCPALVIQTRDDPDTHPSSARSLHVKLSSNRNQPPIVWVDGDDHDALLSSHASELYERIARHLSDNA